MRPRDRTPSPPDHSYTLVCPGLATSHERGRGRAGGQPAVELLVQQLLDRCHRVAEVGLEHLAQHRLRVGGGLDY